MSALFKDILSRHLSKSTKKGRVLASLEADFQAKGLDLLATIEARLDDEVAAEDIEEQMMAAASNRLDDILSDMIRMDVLDGSFFTKATKSRETGTVEVPTTVYGLRDKRGRILSGLGLARLLNLTLYQHVQSLMGPDTLVNRTGRFSHSAHINGIMPQEKGVSIYFSYMMNPYKIFETTEPWSRGGSRSPVDLISRAIDVALKNILNPESYANSIFNIEGRG